MITNVCFPSNRVLNLCDYVPILSTVASVTHLIAHRMLACPESATPSSTLTQHYYAYLTDRSTMRSIVCLLPVIGNVCILLYDLALFLIHFPITNPGDWRLYGIANILHQRARQPQESPETCNKGLETITHQVTRSQPVFLQLCRHFFFWVNPSYNVETLSMRQAQLSLVTQMIPPAWKKDPQFVFAFVGMYFQHKTVEQATYSSCRFQHIDGIVPAQIIHEVADAELWKNKDFVEQAIGITGDALQYADIMIKRDVLWVPRMMQLYPDRRSLILSHCDPSLRQEESLLRMLLEYKQSYPTAPGSRIRNNVDYFAFLCLSQTKPDNLDMPTWWSQQQQFLIEAIAQDATVFSSLQQLIRSNDPISMFNQTFSRYICDYERLLKDNSFLAQVVAANGRRLLLLPEAWQRAHPHVVATVLLQYPEVGNSLPRDLLATIPYWQPQAIHSDYTETPLLPYQETNSTRGPLVTAAMLIRANAWGTTYADDTMADILTYFPYTQ